MIPLMLIVILTGADIRVEQIEFRTIESCLRAQRDVERDLMRLYQIQMQTTPITTTTSCVDRGIQ